MSEQAGLDIITIANDLLERSGHGMMAGDFDLFAGCFHLPQYFETFSGPQCVETLQDLRALFDAVRDYYESIGVESLIRRVIHAEWKEPDTFEYVHEARLMRGTTVLQEPYPVFSTVKLTDDGWKVVGASYAIVGSPRHEKALSSPKTPRP